MQRRFIHERIKNPDPNNPDEMTFLLFRAFCESQFLFRKSPLFSDKSITPDSFPMRFESEALIRAGLNPGGVTLVPFYTDPAMATLALISGKFIHGEPRSFVFQKEFWPMLLRTRMTQIRWHMFPKEFAATFQFPDPIIDHDGDEIHEAMVAIMSREEAQHLRRKAYEDGDGEGSRALCMWWMTGNRQVKNLIDLNLGYLVQFIPDGEAEIIPKTWSDRFTESHLIKKTRTTDHLPLEGRRSHVEALIKALFYVCSGKPDIRAERNKIMTKPGTNVPIAAHRDFSRVKYELVGWNWMKKILMMKERKYSKEEWPVKPFPRYQPYGPIGNPTHHEWIIVEGHMRERRAGRLNL